MHSPDETIVAIASPPGGGARGIVRLSGPSLRECLEPCFHSVPSAPLASLTRPTVVHGRLSLAGFASPAPCELYLWPLNKSYTGQPVAEIHTLGSPPLLEAIVRAVCSAGARPAAPGEFTLRAFLAGRIDLTQAEAVLGVIDATAAAELDAALKQLAGGFAAPLRQLRGDLLELLAHLEAGFDFADEDLPFITPRELLGQLHAASAQVEQLAAKLASRGEVAARVHIAIVGPPNAGKSSLFNALIGRNRQGGARAIVSEQPGTTRDYLIAELELDGLKCELIDTAGIDPCASASSAAPIERAAQDVTHEQSRTAHVRLLCMEASGAPDPSAFEEANESSCDIRVLTKCDRFPRAGLPAPADAISHPNNPAILFTSALTGRGLDELRSAIRAAALRACGSQTEVVAGTAIRCGESLRLAAASLAGAQSATSAGLGEELIAMEMRVALSEIGKVAGAVYTDDVLDRIFSRFCIGK